MRNLPTQTKSKNLCLRRLRQTAKVTEANPKQRLKRKSHLSLIEFAIVLCLLLLQTQTENLCKFAANSIQFCDALKMINLDVPKSALAGDTIKLSCFYSLAVDSTEIGSDLQLARRNSATQKAFNVNVSFPLSNLNSNSNLKPNSNSNELSQANDKQQTDSTPSSEMLYAIKWYKEEKEFFRYLAQEWPHKQALPLDGVQVDLHRSDNRSVVLRSVSLQTSGLYKCEVSTDAPNFITKSIESKLSVYSLPSGGPQISQIGTKQANDFHKSHRQHNLQRTQSFVSLGDRIELQCVAPETKPATQIDWIVNDSLNLSKVMPNNSLGLELFELINNRYTKLPLKLNSKQFSSSLLSRPQALTNQSLILDLTSNGNENPLDRQALVTTDASNHKDVPESSVYADFEIFELKSSTGSGPSDDTRTAFKAVPKASSMPTITLSSQSLDQLLETSVSTLNFTISSELIQLLATTNRSKVSAMQSISYVDSNPSEQVSSQRFSVKSQRLSGSTQQLERSSRKLSAAANSKLRSQGNDSNEIASTASMSSKSSDRVANVSKTANPSKRKTAFVRGETGSGSSNKFGSGGKNVIQIKCVARILNLNMFDEIRLIVQTDRIPSSHHRQDKPSSKSLLSETDKNSANCFSLRVYNNILVIGLVLMQRIIHHILEI